MKPDRLRRRLREAKRRLFSLSRALARRDKGRRCRTWAQHEWEAGPCAVGAMLDKWLEGRGIPAPSSAGYSSLECLACGEKFILPYGHVDEKSAIKLTDDEWRKLRSCP